MQVIYTMAFWGEKLISTIFSFRFSCFCFLIIFVSYLWGILYYFAGRFWFLWKNWTLNEGYSFEFSFGNFRVKRINLWNLINLKILGVLKEIYLSFKLCPISKQVTPLFLSKTYLNSSSEFIFHLPTINKHNKIKYNLLLIYSGSFWHSCNPEYCWLVHKNYK